MLYRRLIIFVEVTLKPSDALAADDMVGIDHLRKTV